MKIPDPDPKSWPIVPPGIWLEARMARLAKPRPALFLDRDGVIIRDTGYLADPAKAALIPESVALIKAANQANTPILVITNQSGIDRGLYNWDDFAAVEARIADLLGAQGAKTDATAACPFHPHHTTGYSTTQANWRKPGSGMIVTLAENLNINLANSWLIGDQLRDVEAARNAGLAGGILTGDPFSQETVQALYDLAQPNFEPKATSWNDDALTLLRATPLFP